MSKMIALDFDGVLHSYTSGWQGPGEIPDPPTPGAQEFCRKLLGAGYEVVVFSSRSNYVEGLRSIHLWLTENSFPSEIRVVTQKPSAHVALDDRSITFMGHWPSIDEIVNFKPWNRQ